MEKRTLEQLEAALTAVSKDLAQRVEELAKNSTAGELTEGEHQEYAEVRSSARAAQAISLRHRLPAPP
jgi:hypothetical protein